MNNQYPSDGSIVTKIGDQIIRIPPMAELKHLLFKQTANGQHKLVRSLSDNGFKRSKSTFSNRRNKSVPQSNNNKSSSPSASSANCAYHYYSTLRKYQQIQQTLNRIDNKRKNYIKNNNNKTNQINKNNNKQPQINRTPRLTIHNVDPKKDNRLIRRTFNHYLRTKSLTRERSLGLTYIDENQ